MKIQCEDLIGLWCKHLTLVGGKEESDRIHKCIESTKLETDNIHIAGRREKSPLVEEKQTSQKIIIQQFSYMELEFQKAVLEFWPVVMFVWIFLEQNSGQ